MKLKGDQTAGQLVSDDVLRSIIDEFPSGVVHSFGYGSGVFVQNQQRVSRCNESEEESGNDQHDVSAVPMLDMILVVENSKAWHEENLRVNRDHYSFLPRTLGCGYTDWLQKFGKGKTYFNPLVSIDIRDKLHLNQTINRQVKYGIIEKVDLMNDLLHWKYLYIAGRLQKPTALVDVDDEIIEAQKKNIHAALATAILINSDTKNDLSHKEMTLTLLYESIANLSYAGDPRMQVRGEDPNKISKLVNSPGQIERWNDLYYDPINHFVSRGMLSIDKSNKVPTIQWSTEVSACNTFGEYLPKRIVQQYTAKSFVGNRMAKLVASIVAPAARHQSMKGLFTAGFSKSLQYAAAKFSKGWKSS